MIDMQLMHVALAGIGIASAAAVLVAVLILTIAAGLRDRRRHHAGTPAGPPVASQPVAGQPAGNTATARREPALR